MNPRKSAWKEREAFSQSDADECHPIPAPDRKMALEEESGFGDADERYPIPPPDQGEVRWG